MCGCGRLARTHVPESLCGDCAVEFWQGAIAYGSAAAKLQRIIAARPPLSSTEEAAIVDELAHAFRAGAFQEWIDRGGVELPPWLSRPQAVREAVANGMSDREAAVAFGVSTATIRRDLNRRRRLVTPADREGILELLGQGLTLEQVARRTGFGHATISKIRTLARAARWPRSA